MKKVAPVSRLKMFPALFLLAALLLSACSPVYVFQAAVEEGKILWRREPIQAALAQPGLDPERREKFELVLAVRDYARDVLGFRVGKSYSTISYVNRPVLSYVLMAVPATDLQPYTWWYLFVGSFPYKGFFSEEEAEAEAKSFRAEGYDTFIRTSPAFSTLGWFDDPLLDHLLKYDKVTLAEVIFHELLHNTLFVTGAVDFNESLANFVGDRAAIRFFRERYGEGSPGHRRAVEAWEEELEFSAFIARLADSLRQLYAQDLPDEEKLKRREKVFSEAKEQWARRSAARPSHQYRGFAKQKLNNAVIAHYLLYVKDLDLFDSLYQAEGGDIARMVQRIRERLASDGGEPFETVRRLVAEKKP